MGGPANLYRPLTQHEKEEKIEEKLTLEESCCWKDHLLEVGMVSGVILLKQEYKQVMSLISSEL